MLRSVRQTVETRIDASSVGSQKYVDHSAPHGANDFGEDVVSLCCPDVRSGKGCDVSVENARTALQTADMFLGELPHAIATLQEQWKQAEAAVESAHSTFLEGMTKR
jgi:hypothetical protein